MKQVLLMIAAVALVGCHAENKKNASKAKAIAEAKAAAAEANATVTQKSESPKVVPEKLIADPIVEKAIRESLKKLALLGYQRQSTGELIEADLAKVDKLWLNNTKITDEGLKELAKLQNLIDLNLSYTKITDASLKDVAKLKNLKNLTLMNTQITDAGAAELKKAMPNCIIFHFNIAD